MQNFLELSPGVRKDKPVIQVRIEHRRRYRIFTMFMPCKLSQVAQETCKRAALRNTDNAGSFQPDIRRLETDEKKARKPSIFAQRMRTRYKPQMGRNPLKVVSCP